MEKGVYISDDIPEHVLAAVLTIAARQPVQIYDGSSIAS